MAIVNCPECQKEISDQAVMCPHCGYPLRDPYGYEYRSERTLFGLPLVHIVGGRGFNPVTGRLRVAKGIIAVGPVAIGGLAMGGMSFGILSFGGVALGVAAFGGAAIGVLLAAGGAAIGGVAIGGAAIGYYAFGGGVWGVHALGGNVQDPNLLETFKGWLPRGTRP
jgi:hypothetical protein